LIVGYLDGVYQFSHVVKSPTVVGWIHPVSKSD